MTNEKQTKGLQVLPSFGALADAADFRETLALIRENVGEGGLEIKDLERIKIPAGGGQAWTVTTLDGEESQKEITGVVIYAMKNRAYWEDAYSGGNLPPNCHSRDNLRGEGTPGGECAHCEFSQWGSDSKGGGGKACKELTLLFLLHGENKIPSLLVLPPTSGAAWKSFGLSLASRSVAYSHAVISIGLEKAQSKSGIAYSKATFKAKGRLSPEQATLVVAFREMLQGRAQTVDLTTSDYSVSD